MPLPQTFVSDIGPPRLLSGLTLEHPRGSTVTYRSSWALGGPLLPEQPSTPRSQGTQQANDTPMPPSLLPAPAWTHCRLVPGQGLSRSRLSTAGLPKDPWMQMMPACYPSEVRSEACQCQEMIWGLQGQRQITTRGERALRGSCFRFAGTPPTSCTSGW